MPHYQHFIDFGETSRWRKFLESNNFKAWDREEENRILGSIQQHYLVMVIELVMDRNLYFKCHISKRGVVRCVKIKYQTCQKKW